MPGIKEQAPQSAPPRARRAPLIDVLETTGPVGPLPDPKPYQTVRELKLTVPGGVVTIEDTYWTLRGLRRWLRACPKEVVSLRLPTGLDPRDGEAPQFLPVSYDGFRFDVPYGTPTAVPAPIAEIVRQSQDPYPTTRSRGLDLYAITPRTPNGRLLGEDGAFDADQFAADDDDDEE